MKKRCTYGLLSVLFVISTLMTLTVAAAPVNQDGVKASLSSAKASYAANEDIDIALNVKNTNEYEVKGITTSITLPDGVELKEGDLEQETYSLAAGADSTNEIVAIKNVVVTTKEKSPQTGDNSRLILWAILMCASFVCLVVMRMKDKKFNGKGFFSFLLLVSILGTSVSLPVDVKAASETKSFDVSEDLTVDGSKVTISATVSYEQEVKDVTYGVKVNEGTASVTTAAEGDDVTITANEKDGYVFSEWQVVSGDIALADSTNATTTFTMPAGDVEVTAVYKKLHTITVEIIDDTFPADGNITPELQAGSIKVVDGKNQSIQFELPDSYWTIRDLSIDGENIEDYYDCWVNAHVFSIPFENVSEDHLIRIRFVEQQL